jgi:hypothetical protein
LSQYAQGTVRKSRREKEKEAAEAKKREEEESAAKAYADFIDAFEGEGVDKRKAGSGFVRASDGAKVSYQPPVKGPTESSSRTRPVRSNEDESTASGNVPKPKGKRAMDSFLEEIKREQAMREARYSRSSHGRSVTALAGGFSFDFIAIRLKCIALQHTKGRVAVRTAVILRLLTFLWPIYPLMSLNNLLGPFLLVTVLLAP